MRLVLVGNPNCGKTTLFNALSGSNQYVGNWPGVTVEKKSAKLKGHKDIEIVDLPGIYSLSPYTLEEVIARNYLLDEPIDGIINIVDVSNLERNLYLSTQLLELDIPMIMVLNMLDLIDENDGTLYCDKLAKELNIKVISISALKKQGFNALIETLTVFEVKKPQPIVFEAKIENALNAINAITKEEKRFKVVKYLENDHDLLEKLETSDVNQIKQISDGLEVTYDDDCESILANARYNFISELIKNSHVKKRAVHEISMSDKIDRILTNRLLAIPLFMLIMWVVYSISMNGIGAMLSEFVNEVVFAQWVSNFFDFLLVNMGVSDMLYSLVQDGIVAGVGAVLGFVPQIMVLFFLLSFLEDSGYMARIAFIMDRLFRKFGLSGKAFIPLLIATGCGIPGVMATRTIENPKDRRLSVMLTTFMPCGAKLPIFALFAGAVFNESALVATSMYFIAIATIITCGIILKRTKAFRGDVAPFIMELPAYHLPLLKSMLIHMWDRGFSFIKKAGSIILLSTILIWFLQSFNFALQAVEIEESMLASVGRLLAVVFAPLGWGDWRSAIATISGLIAKENIVATFGILFGSSEVSENGLEIWRNISVAFTPLSAYSFMVFNLLCAPCFGAIGAIKRELGTWKDTLITVCFQCGVAYIVALLIYQIGSLL